MLIWNEIVLSVPKIGVADSALNVWHNVLKYISILELGEKKAYFVRTLCLLGFERNFESDN